MSRIGRLRRDLRERGTRATLARLAEGLREGYSEESVAVMFKDLDEIVEPARLGGLEVEELNEDHLRGLRALNRSRGEPQADRYFEESLRYGFHGFAALVARELVGYYWWVDRDNPTPHPDLWRLGSGFSLGPAEVYGASLFLLDAHRGEGRAAEFLFRIESTLSDRGYRRIWGYVDSGNRAARWLYSVRGYRAARLVRIRRLGLFRWRRSSPLSDES